MAAEEAEYWPVQYELLASILDALNGLLTVTLRANGAKNVPQVKTFPRPNSTVVGPWADLDTQVSEPSEVPDNVVSFGKFMEMLKRD